MVKQITRITLLAALLLGQNAIGQNPNQKTMPLFMINKNDSIGFINNKGETVITPQYDGGTEFSEGYAIVKKDSMYYCIDIKGNEHAVMTNMNISVKSGFQNGMALIRNKDTRTYGYLDTTGRIVIPPLFDDAGNFSEGLAPVIINDQCCYIDKNGLRTITSVKWLGKEYQIAGASEFHEGLAAVILKDRNLRGIGYINKNGIMVIDPIYPKAGDFHCGLARVGFDDKYYGYINHNGKYAIGPFYRGAFPFIDSVACVYDTSTSTEAVIDIHGNIVFAAQSPVVFSTVMTDGLIFLSEDEDGIFEDYSTFGIKTFGVADTSATVLAIFNAGYVSGFNNGVARYMTTDTNNGDVIVYINTEMKEIYRGDKIYYKAYGGGLIDNRAVDETFIKTSFLDIIMVEEYVSDDTIAEPEEVLIPDEDTTEEVIIQISSDEFPPPPPPDDDDFLSGTIENVAVIIEEEIDENEIFTVVEEDPEFPGGQEALMKYLAENITYPIQAKENNVTGRVWVSFVIEKDGSITNARVMRNIGAGCGEEAVRIVENMPRWTPGKQRGKPVRVQYNLPVYFTLR